jgi:hypothetical protein
MCNTRTLQWLRTWSVYDSPYECVTIPAAQSSVTTRSPHAHTLRCQAENTACIQTAPTYTLSDMFPNDPLPDYRETFKILMAV